MTHLELPRPWPRKSSERGPDLIICRARFDHVENPRTGETLRRTVLETRHWVNVVALTHDHKLVTVHQYRFGTDAVTVEIPGGVIDPHEQPIDAARRELREECGYSAAEWKYLGSVEPNPAFLDNLCHHFLALGATRTDAQELDPGEDIAVEEIPIDRVRDMIAKGAIKHALVLTALAHVLDLRTTTIR